MQRNLAKLASSQYDVAIVGGGIQGACIAWDAALRGLSVALVERGDFGCATSANSLKTIHGGLRYLRDGDLRLVRRMVRERSAFLRIAPHLVRPLPCVMPTYGRGARGRGVIGAALIASDLVGFDRNWRIDLACRLPRSRLLSRDECLRLAPGLSVDGLTGGALWYDAQMHSAERLTLAFVRSAVNEGADVANYVEATGLLRRDARVTGVQVNDVLTGDQFEIRARVVVNAAGPWADEMLAGLRRGSHARVVRLSTAMNLVTRQIAREVAVGVPSVPVGAAERPRASRLLFIVPWRGYSLIGTTHAPHNGTPDAAAVAQAEIQAFIDEVNRAYAGAALQRQDVYLVHRGFLPAEANDAADGVRLVRRGRVCDHAEGDRIEGLITAISVKYTTARHLAERVVDLVFRKLGRPAPTCTTETTPLYGGRIERLDDFVAQEIRRRPNGLSVETVRHLIQCYGSEYQRVLAYCAEAPGLETPVADFTQVIRAEVLHAVRQEMAQRLADVVLRRTVLGSAGFPGEEGLAASAKLMAAALGWSRARQERELAETRAFFTTTSEQASMDDERPTFVVPDLVEA
jgi:glycerol-3-phosphate dehydrogenase